MKYENFEKVKSICEQIDKTKKVIEDLKSDNISVKVLDNQWTIMTVGSWSSCEHDCKDFASKFIIELKNHYETKLLLLHDDLSRL